MSKPTRETTCGHQPHFAKGKCRKCYNAAYRARRWPKTPRVPLTTTCGHTPHRAKGLCHPCYDAARYAAAPDKYAEQTKAWREAHPGQMAAYYKVWNEAHPGLSTARTKAWREANPERNQAVRQAYAEVNRERDAARKRAKYQENLQAEREKAAMRGRARTAGQKERILLRQARWRKANPEKVRAQAVRRQAWERAQEYGVSADLTNAQWQDILAEFDHRCAYCNRADLPLEQEHMTPVSRGGAHTASNVVPACRSCNAQKHTKTALEWIGPRFPLSHRPQSM